MRAAGISKLRWGSDVRGQRVRAGVHRNGPLPATVQTRIPTLTDLCTSILEVCSTTSSVKERVLPTFI